MSSQSSFGPSSSWRPTCHRTDCDWCFVCNLIYYYSIRAADNEKVWRCSNEFAQKFYSEGQKIFLHISFVSVWTRVDDGLQKNLQKVLQRKFATFVKIPSFLPNFVFFSNISLLWPQKILFHLKAETILQVGQGQNLQTCDNFSTKIFQFVKPIFPISCNELLGEMTVEILVVAFNMLYLCIKTPNLTWRTLVGTGWHGQVDFWVLHLLHVQGQKVGHGEPVLGHLLEIETSNLVCIAL